MSSDGPGDGQRITCPRCGDQFLLDDVVDHVEVAHPPVLDVPPLPPRLSALVRRTLRARDAARAESPPTSEPLAEQDSAKPRAPGGQGGTPATETRPPSDPGP